MLPDHNQYSGTWLAFPGKWLSQGRNTLSDEQKRAGKAIRAAFSYRFAREGGDALALMIDVQRKALAAIEKHGYERYIEQVERIAGKDEA